MSPALCTPTEYNRVRVLRNPGAILRRQLRRRNRGKILSVIPEDIDFAAVTRESGKRGARCNAKTIAAN